MEFRIRPAKGEIINNEAFGKIYVTNNRTKKSSIFEGMIHDLSVFFDVDHESVIKIKIIVTVIDIYLIRVLNFLK